MSCHEHASPVSSNSTRSQPRPHRLGPTWRHHERPDLVARARELVEESGLGREAIAAALGVGVATVTNWRRRFGWVWAPGPRRGRRPAVPGVAWPKLWRRAGAGREHPPATVAAARRLFEAGHTTVVIARTTGAGTAAVRRWAARDGWRRPSPVEMRIVRRAAARVASQDRFRAPASPAPTDAEVRAAARAREARLCRAGPRFRFGRGRRYVPDVVQRVRVLVEGSAASEAEIAARTGISQSTVSRWTHRHRWQRPAEAPRWPRLLAAERSGLGSRLVAALDRLAVLAEREGRHEPASPPLRAQRSNLGAARRPLGCFVADAPRNDEGARAAEIAAVCRRLAGHLRKAGDRDAPRLTVRPPRRRDRPRGDGLFEEARHLVERTTLRQSEIAARLGISRLTLVRWKQVGGWLRGPDAPSPYGGPARSAARAIRGERRIEARRRLGEAERGLDASERAEAARPGRLEALEAVFDALAGAVEILQRPVGPAARLSGGSRAARRRCGSWGASA